MTTIQFQQKKISQGITPRVVTIQSTTNKKEITRGGVITNNKKAIRRTTTTATTLNMLTENQLLISRCVLSFFAVTLCLYLYMVVSIVVATVDRKSLEEQVRLLSTELSSVESEYSSAIGSITLADVKRSGFVDAGEATFAVRETLPTLTLGNEQR